MVKLLKPRSESSDTNEQYLQGFSHLSSNDLLDFASAITPKLYFYVIMPQIPPSKSEDKNRKVEYLYIN